MLHIYFIKPYFPKKNNSIIYNNVKYNMGWFNNNNNNDNNDNNNDNNNNDNKSNSSNNIDWDAYDQLNNDKQQSPEERGVIEAPANAETIIYESPDGQQYEISISDLIEADDDNEIKYTAPKNQDYYKLKSSYKKTKKYITAIQSHRYFTFSH